MEDPIDNQGAKAQLEITRKWHLVGAVRALRIVIDDLQVAINCFDSSLSIGSN